MVQGSGFRVSGFGVRVDGCGFRVEGTTTSQKCEAVPRRARFKARRFLYHSTLGSRVIKKKKIRRVPAGDVDAARVLLTKVLSTGGVRLHHLRYTKVYEP